MQYLMIDVHSLQLCVYVWWCVSLICIMVPAVMWDNGNDPTLAWLGVRTIQLFDDNLACWRLYHYLVLLFLHAIETNAETLIWYDHPFFWVTTLLRGPQFYQMYKLSHDPSWEILLNVVVVLQGYNGGKRWNNSFVVQKHSFKLASDITYR